MQEIMVTYNCTCSSIYNICYRIHNNIMEPNRLEKIGTLFCNGTNLKLSWLLTFTNLHLFVVVPSFLPYSTYILRQTWNIASERDENVNLLITALFTLLSFLLTEEAVEHPSLVLTR